MSAKRFRYLVIFFGLLVLGPVAVFGQSVDELCEDFIDAVFPQIGTNCADLGVGSACYGYGDVAATFFVDGQPQQVLDDVFSVAADRTAVLDGSDGSVLESLDAVEFALDREDVLESDWGVALQEVQANLPGQTGDSVLYIVFGGGRIENSVLPEEALVLGAPVEVSYDRVNVFTSPEGLGYQVASERVETLSGGGSLEADAISPDGAWARVFFPYDRTFGERLTAWVRVDELTELAGIEELPVLGPDTYTTMQNVYLDNPLTRPACEIVPPPGLMIQGPDRVETDVVVNDLPIRVTSTAYVRRINANTLEVVAISGIVVTDAETADELVIPEGYSGYFCLSDPLDLGIDQQDNDRQVTDDCQPQLVNPCSNGVGAFGGLGNLPDNVLRYVPQVPNGVSVSGVGGARCEARNIDDNRIIELCQAGTLPANICDVLLPGGGN